MEALELNASYRNDSWLGLVIKCFHEYAGKSFLPFGNPGTLMPQDHILRVPKQVSNITHNYPRLLQ
jgi:hypothetical protein